MPRIIADNSEKDKMMNPLSFNESYTQIGMRLTNVNFSVAFILASQLILMQSFMKVLKIFLGFPAIIDPYNTQWKIFTGSSPN
jgi:hypothetical protein